MTGEYRVIITIITIIIITMIIIIVIFITVAVASKIFFYIHRSVVTVTVVYMVNKFVKPLQRNFS